MSSLVTGIGGSLFRSKDEKALSLWYEKHFDIYPVGSDKLWEQQSGITVFFPFKQDSKYFPAEQQIMINFPVSNLDKFREQVKAEAVRIDDEKIDDSHVKFAWVYDPEGNKIELWQPTNES